MCAELVSELEPAVEVPLIFGGGNFGSGGLHGVVLPVGGSICAASVGAGIDVSAGGAGGFAATGAGCTDGTAAGAAKTAEGVLGTATAAEDTAPARAKVLGAGGGCALCLTSPTLRLTFKPGKFGTTVGAWLYPLLPICTGGGGRTDATLDAAAGAGRDATGAWREADGCSTV